MRPLIEEFVRWKKSYRKRIGDYYDIWLRVFDDFCSKPIDKIVLADIVNFSEFLESKYDPKTVQLVMSLVKHFFKYCNQLGYSAIPHVLIKVKMAPEKIPDIIEKSGFIEVLDKIPQNTWKGLRLQVCLRLMWDCALRVGELVSLDYDQLDLKKKQAKIKVEKSDKERFIFWGDETNKLLDKYIGIRKEIATNHKALLIGKGGYKFYAPRLSVRTIQLNLKRYGLNPHMIRHSKIHDMAKNNAQMHDIHYMLRHSKDNVRSTLDYLRWWGPEAERSARKFL